MKKKIALILTVILSSATILSACGGSEPAASSAASSEAAVTEAPATPTPAPTATPTPEPTATPEPTPTPIPLKEIGEQAENTHAITIKNSTGAVITGISVKREDDEDYPENMLSEDDPFEIDEERVLHFPESAEEFVAPEAEEGQAAIENALLIPEYTIRLTTKVVPESEDEEAEEKVYVLHSFPVGDVESLAIAVDEETDLAYITYKSVSSSQDISTLEMEKAIEQSRKEAEEAEEAAAEAAAQAAAEQAAAQEEETYYEEPSYEEDYQEDYYEEPSWEEPSWEEPSYEEPSYEEPDTSQDGCVTDGLLNP